ncbi:hypothetical protein [Lysobacter sp. ESA13C]|uniref:hypothetical protein n=1 Tax=Lysobacter sp. ESA13C TaxID=2862676 RepID=UPI001CBFB457|nr:hypothetical protein [Lysobacter sp. ESA13C]
MDTNPNDGAGAGTAAPPAAGTPGAPADAATGGSAFSAVAPPAQGDSAAPPATPAPIHERIPEKYRVAKEDGTFDLEASTAKMLDGHAALEKRLGTGEAPPKDADSYDPKVDGFDMEALKQDPDYQKFLKGAHGAGLTNKQVEYVLSQYASSAALAQVDSTALSAEAFKAEMVGNHWKGAGEYEENMSQAMKAIRAYEPDITAEEISGLPNHPIVAKILAAVGRETAEDRAVRVNPMSAADFDTQLASLHASPAYMDAMHPEHSKVIKQIEGLFQKRYPTP